MKLNARERRDLEDGIRRATALQTYQSEWAWFVKRRSSEIIQRALEHTPGSAKQFSYEIGMSSSTISSLRKGISKLRPEQYYKIIKQVYPEYANLIEAELRDIERLHD
jgi:hypothetical protein|tara:strand:+ start:834 stop:1157 length:324 start_codon:yes stop_codon:yes gene_type:complete